MTDARVVSKQEELNKEQRITIWEALLLLENNKFDEAQEKIDLLDEMLPDKEKNKAKYEGGEEIPDDRSNKKTQSGR
jgi:hypothetical protein